MTFDSKNGVLYLDELQGQIKINKNMVSAADLEPTLKKEKRFSIGSLASSKALLFKLKRGFSFSEKTVDSTGNFTDSSTDDAKEKKSEKAGHCNTAIIFGRQSYLESKSLVFRDRINQMGNSPGKSETHDVHERPENDTITGARGNVNKQSCASCESMKSQNHSEVFICDHKLPGKTLLDLAVINYKDVAIPETSSPANGHTRQEFHHFQNTIIDKTSRTESEDLSQDFRFQDQIQSRDNHADTIYIMQDKMCCDYDSNDHKNSMAGMHGSSISCACHKNPPIKKSLEKDINPELNNNINITTDSTLFAGLTLSETSQSDKINTQNTTTECNVGYTMTTEHTVTKDNMAENAGELLASSDEFEEISNCHHFCNCLCFSKKQYSSHSSSPISYVGNDQNSGSDLTKKDSDAHSYGPTGDQASGKNVLRPSQSNLNCDIGSDVSFNSGSDSDCQSDSRPHVLSYSPVHLEGYNSNDEVSNRTCQRCFHSPLGSVDSDIHIIEYDPPAARTRRLASAPASLGLLQGDSERLSSLYEKSLHKCKRSSSLPVKSALKLKSTKSKDSPGSAHVRFSLPNLEKVEFNQKDLKDSNIKRFRGPTENNQITNSSRFRWQLLKSKLRIGQNNQETSWTNRSRSFNLHTASTESPKTRNQRFNVSRKGMKQGKTKEEKENCNQQLYLNLDMEKHDENDRGIVSMPVWSGTLPSQDDDGSSIPLLHIAAADGDLDLVKTLIEVGVDLNETDNQGWPAIHYAICKGHFDCATLLIENGVSLECYTTKVMNEYVQTVRRVLLRTHYVNDSDI